MSNVGRAAVAKTAWMWITLMVVAAIMGASLSLAAFVEARRQGWLDARTFHEARVDRVQLGRLERGVRRSTVEWTLEAEGARGSALLDVDERALPTRVAVAFDPASRRWYARDDAEHDSATTVGTLVAAIASLVTALWAAVMAWVRRRSENIPSEAVVDREALSAIAKRGRASWMALRVVALLGFYFGLHALSLAIVALCVGGALLMLYEERVQVGVAVTIAVALFGIGRVYLSVFRSAEGRATGVLLVPSEHPAFFAELAAVAAQCNTRVPDAVYLADMRNAGVSEASKLFGLLSGKRTLVLGWTLVCASTVSELRAVLAHEFGHFVGGDTRLGAVVYAVRQRAIAIVQSIQRAHQGIGGINMALPFLWYLEVFLFATRKLSRVQELLADKLSIAVAGRGPHVSELRKSRVASVTGTMFRLSEVEPLLRAGLIPQHIERAELEYERNMLDPELEAAIARRFFSVPTDPFDTHPALAERVAFADEVSDSATATDDRPATVLFDAPACEAQVASDRRRAIESKLGRSLREVSFADGFLHFWMPRYAHLSQSVAARVAGDDGGLAGIGRILDPSSIDAVCFALDSSIAPQHLSAEDKRAALESALQARIIIVLAHEPGSKPHFELGRPLRVERADGSVVVPLDLARALLDKPDERAQVAATLMGSRVAS